MTSPDATGGRVLHPMTSDRSGTPGRQSVAPRRSDGALAYGVPCIRSDACATETNMVLFRCGTIHDSI